MSTRKTDQREVAAAVVSKMNAGLRRAEAISEVAIERVLKVSDVSVAFMNFGSEALALDTFALIERSTGH